MLIYIAIVGIIFGLELWIKNYVEKKWEHDKKKPILYDLLVLQKYHNKGAFLNLGATKQKLVAIISITLTIVMLVIFAITFFSFSSSRNSIN